MLFTVAYNKAEGIIEARLMGEVDFQRAKEAIKETIQVVKETDCKLILSDTREADIELSLVDFYELVKFIAKEAESAGVKIHSIKRAHVGRSGLAELNFFETALVNRGQIMKLFNDVDEAKQWLKGRG